MLYNLRGTSRDDNVGRHITGNNGSRGHDAIIANCYSLENSGVITQPDIIANMHGCGFIPCHTIVNHMPIRIRDVRAVREHYAITQYDLITRTEP